MINQTYAYDFSLNLAQDVLCMRDGTVVDYVDNIDDGDHDHEGNHIVIKHITAANPNFDAVHDKTPEVSTRSLTPSIITAGKTASSAPLVERYRRMA